MRGGMMVVQRDLCCPFRLFLYIFVALFFLSIGCLTLPGCCIFVCFSFSSLRVSCFRFLFISCFRYLVFFPSLSSCVFCSGGFVVFVVFLWVLFAMVVLIAVLSVYYVYILRPRSIMYTSLLNGRK